MTVTRYDDDAYAIDVLRAQIAPEATDGELALFARVCQAVNLSPFADQIVLIGRYDGRAGRKVHRHQITVAGRRALAERTGELLGIEGPEWTGPRDDRQQLHWSELWTEDGPDHPPYAARVFVHRAGWVKPANGTAKWSEFRQLDRSGQLLQQWRTMPAHMLGKVAEAMALRRAFPNVITSDVVGTWAGAGDEVLEASARNAVAGDTWDVDEVAVDVSSPDVPPGEDVTGPAVAASATGPARPPVTTAQNTQAHQEVLAHYTDSDKAALLERYGVTFGEVWPDACVLEVLERPL